MALTLRGWDLVEVDECSLCPRVAELCEHDPPMCLRCCTLYCQTSPKEPT